MGDRDLETLEAQVDPFCKEPRNSVEKCLEKQQEESLSCSSPLQQASKCEQAVQRAFRHINMAGCPREIQAVTICDVEWCEYGRGDREAQEACQNECLAVRETLDACIKTHVISFFKRYGLEENGMIKLQ